MGWSCAQRAGIVLNALQDFCYNQTGITNVFVHNRKRFMFEVGRENSDGAITAQTINMDTNKKSTGLRIEPNGKISRGPKTLTEIPVYFLEIESRLQLPAELWKGTELTDTEMLNQLQIWRSQFLPGGANQHIGECNPTKATVTDVDNNVVLEWNAPAFMLW